MKGVRDYNAAIMALNTLQTNANIIEAIRASGMLLNLQSIPEMTEWCKRVGHEPSDFDRLRPIHVAGTKGKGSTCAFISSILSNYIGKSNGGDLTLRKIGLYTSPHLRHVNERIQINNVPLRQETFARYFFEVWNRLESAAKSRNEDPAARDSKPVYFRYLTLMGLHAYLREGVDAAVIECGVGGEYDSTNILQRPFVTAVTSLGIDHQGTLGNTIEEIAWHKAGIFKDGVPAFTVEQPGDSMEVLQQRAKERKTRLHVVGLHPQLRSIKLGISGDFQRLNASIAIASAAAFLRSSGFDSAPDPYEPGRSPLPEEFIRGLQDVKWPGRCEIRQDHGIAWHLDGGHTVESMAVAGRWFADQLLSSDDAENPRENRTRILIFNQQSRDPKPLINALDTAMRTASSPSSRATPFFTHVIFSTNQTFAESGFSPDLLSMNQDSNAVDKLLVQKNLAKTWREIDSQANVEVTHSIEEAIGRARRIAADEMDGNGIEVLITGSLHLVGGALEVLESGGIAKLSD